MHAAALKTWCKNSDVLGPRDFDFTINVFRYKIYLGFNKKNWRSFLREMRNFFPFLPMILFGNPKMKILETRSQKVKLKYVHRGLKKCRNGFLYICLFNLSLRCYLLHKSVPNRVSFSYFSVSVCIMHHNCFISCSC